MAASVQIIIKTFDSVLQIPEKAIIYKDKKTYVLVNKFMQKKLVPVKIGSKSDGKVIIEAGMREGDTVLIKLSDKK